MTNWTNLLEETLEVLEENRKSPKDVKWVGVNWENLKDAKVFEWKDFEVIANIEYVEGSYVINPSLVIVGDNWWLERVGDLGFEWWAYKTIPVKFRFCRIPVVEDILQKGAGVSTYEGGSSLIASYIS